MTAPWSKRPKPVPLDRAALNDYMAIDRMVSHDDEPGAETTRPDGTQQAAEAAPPARDDVAVPNPRSPYASPAARREDEMNDLHGRVARLEQQVHDLARQIDQRNGGQR